jgi:hypothetical protein
LLWPLSPFVARLMNFAQSLAQRFNFPLVGDFLAFGQFDELKHFLHLVERLFEHFDNLRGFFHRPVDGGGRGFDLSFGQCRRVGRRTSLGNWFRSPRAAPTATTVAAPPSTAGTSRRRGKIGFSLWFLRHFRFEHDALPEKSKGEL